MSLFMLPPALPPLPPLPPLRPYQAAVREAVLASVRAGAGHTFSVMVSRQGGKNELSARLEAELLLRSLDREADGIKCAPTFEPQGRISLRRLWTRLEDLGVARFASIEQGHCVRLGRARQFFLSAEPAAHVVGHTVHLLLEVDEAQDVDAATFDQRFRPMASTTNSTTVYYGTAWTETDLLAEMRRRHLELERRDGVRRHFEVTWEEVARHNPAYATFVTAERERLGEDHPLFVTQYLLRPLASGGRLFSAAQRALLAGAHERLAGPGGARKRALLGYVAGLDVGGEAFAGGGRRVGGPDRTVLTIARVLAPAADAVVQEPQLEVVEQAAWQGTGHAELIGGLGRLLREVWRVRRLVIDATGVGEGLASALAAQRGGPAIVRLRLTEQRKSDLGYGLLAAVNAGRLRLYRADGSAEHQATWGEIALARAEYRAGRRLAWFVDPAEGHDDFLMSLALTVEAASGLRQRAAQGRRNDD